MGRSWGGFSTPRGRQRLFGAGVMFEEMQIPDDTGGIIFNPPFQQEAFLFPQGGGRAAPGSATQPLASPETPKSS